MARYIADSSSGNAIFDILQMAIKEKNYLLEMGMSKTIYSRKRYSKNMQINFGKKFENKSLLITGLEDIRMKDLLNIVKEMFDNKIGLSFDYDKRTEAHYKNTPFTINMDDNTSPV